MAYLDDMPAATARRLEELECPTFPISDWGPLDDVASRTVAIISSAGIHTRATAPFRGGDTHYACIPDEVPDADVLMSHVSVNFDRTGFQRDLESIFPRRVLGSLAREGRIGGVARNHYSFMGASDPRDMEPHARDLATRMKAEGTDTALLIPV